MNIALPERTARFRADLEVLTGPSTARLGVAVSGGPDSLALLLLTHAAFPGQVAAATVDHGLRAESPAEAAFVADVCARLGVPHDILAAGMTDTANIQAAARHARYTLLEAWAAGAGIGWLLTAHHLDDQAETLVMRLQRGAGLAGLAGIRAVKPGRVPVARPLLGWRREALAAIVAEAGLTPVADPSNADPRYDRARLRQRLAATDWLDPAPIARSAGALAEAQGALEWAADRLWDERVKDGTLDPGGLPAELRRRLVLRIFTAMGAAPPRGEEMGRLLATLDGGGTTTLAGIKASGGPLWRFEPAPPRRA